MTAEHLVHAPAGDVIGFASRPGVTAYLGIPFALPPTGDRRFRAPVACPRWDRPFVADRFGDSPMQERSPFTDGMTLSEDCLTLNVWAPDGATDRPVVLWVYGGGFAGGTSALPLFDGGRLAAESGAVVVSANHRTGALGFATLTHRGLPEASNLGLLDIVAALHWVGRNIRSFGGDPARVTVLGQSSGAFLAAALLAVPEARASFAGLVLISGGASRIVPQDQAERLGDQLLAAAGAGSGPELLAVPAERIVAAQRHVGSQDIGKRNGPVPDSLGVALDRDAGGVLAAHPLQVIASGQAAEVPLLLIVTGAEVAGLRGPDSAFVPGSIAAIADEIAGWGAPDPEALAAAYGAGDADLGGTRERVLTDFVYRLPAARAALAQNAAGGRAWLAQIDEPDGSAAPHDLPVRVLFGNLPDADPLSALSVAVRETVTGFVTSAECAWRPFDSSDAEVMHVGDCAQAVVGDFEELLRRWEGVERP